MGIMGQVEDTRIQRLVQVKLNTERQKSIGFLKNKRSRFC